MDIKDRRLLLAAGVPEKQVEAIGLLIQDAERASARFVIKAVQRRVMETNWSTKPPYQIVEDLDKLVKEMFR